MDSLQGRCYISLLEARRFLNSNIPALAEIAHRAYDEKYLKGDYETPNPLIKASDNLGYDYRAVWYHYDSIKYRKSYKEASDYMYMFFKDSYRIFPKDGFEANIRWAVSHGYVEASRLLEFKDTNKNH